MRRSFNQFQVADLIVASILINVVDVVSFRDFSVVVLPYSPVKSFSFVLIVESTQIERFSVKLLYCTAYYLHFHILSPPYVPPGPWFVSTHHSEA